MNSTNINIIVKNLVGKYKTNEPKLIAEQENICILEGKEALPNSIYGIVANVMGQKTIYITSDLSNQDKKIVISRGIGMFFVQTSFTNCMISDENTQVQLDSKVFTTFLLEMNVINQNKNSSKKKVS